MKTDRTVRVLLILGSLVLLFCISCAPSKGQSNISLREDEKPDSLVIYTSGIPYGFMISEDSGTENQFEMYPSMAVMGGRRIPGELEAPYGNIFAKALEDFSNETGIEIELHFLEEYSGQSDILQEKIDNGDSMPDALLVGKYAWYDYIRLAEQGLLLDFSELIQQDEDLGNADKYYHTVLQGGEINKKQYILPILFNLNAMITSESYLSQIGMSIPEDQPYTYEEYIHLFTESCVVMQNNSLQEALYETSGDMVAGSYFPSILTAAAYPSYWGDNQELLIEKETIVSILEMMLAYYKQEFTDIPDWENRDYSENVNDMKGKQRSLLGANNMEICQNVGIFLTGGRNGGVNISSSLLSDAAYYHFLYEESGEEMVLKGIPTVADNQRYSANITQMLLGFQNTEYPEAVYALARYLMDYEYPVYYGFSINQDLTQKQLEQMQSTTFTVYPDWIWPSLMSGSMSMEEAKEETEEIPPLDADVVKTIEVMLDHMLGAGFPFAPLENSMYRSMLEGVHNKEYTPEEAAEWLIEHLEEHQEVQANLKPFYDKEYEHMLLRWDEGE